ncbi:hypothetical protein ACS0TY_010629 [Phlomoides rotata]
MTRSGDKEIFNLTLHQLHGLLKRIKLMIKGHWREHLTEGSILSYLVRSTSYGVPVWHFPEKVYESEETLRKCAESALASVIGDLSHTSFVGNAPMGHMVLQPSENEKVDKVQKVIHSLLQFNTL